MLFKSVRSPSFANAVYAPTQSYDNIKLCNTIGVYKNDDGSTIGRFDAENNYLRTVKLNPESKSLKPNDFLIFPIPSNGQIKIRYSETRDSKLQVVNLLGVVVKEINLAKEVQGITTNIGDLSSGIYLYRHVSNNEILHVGKLIIEN